MQRSCISSFIYFAVIAGVYYLVIHTQTQTPFGFDLLLAGLCALFTGLFLTGCLSFLTARRDWAALRRAEQGEPFQDGRMEAAIGAIQPLGQPLTSPFQQLPCVAYTYKISHRETTSSSRDGSNTSEVTDFSGYALAPAVIRSLRGDVRLPAFTDLDAFNCRLNQAHAAQNAGIYIQNTDFEQVGLISTFSVAVQTIKEPGITARKDWQIHAAGLQADQTFEEQVVPVGQQVTALGFYSSEQNSFVPRSSWNFMEQVSNRLLKGEWQSRPQATGRR